MAPDEENGSWGLAAASIVLCLLAICMLLWISGCAQTTQMLADAQVERQLNEALVKRIADQAMQSAQRTATCNRLRSENRRLRKDNDRLKREHKSALRVLHITRNRYNAYRRICDCEAVRLDLDP